MKFCPHCGKELSVQSSFCPHCGETLVGKTNDLNIFREFWIILTGSCLLAILSFMDWVTIATDDIGLNPYSLWRELSGINNHGSSPSQEFLIVQFSTIIILFLLNLMMEKAV